MACVPEKKAWLSVVGAHGLVFMWWLVIISFVVDPYLIYRVVANPNDSSQVSVAWRRIGVWSNLNRAAFYLPFLVFHPHSYLLTIERNWLLHSIGIVALVIGLVPLLMGPWTKDKALDLLDAEGIISGRAAVVYLGMLLLATSRRSAILNFHGFGYLDLVAFHKAAGWWCVAMSLIHSLAYVAYFLVEGGLRRLLSECFPTVQCFEHGHWKSCLNASGFVNFVGVIGTVAVVILAVFSRERVRRRMYEQFYIIHLVTSSFFVFFVALHDFPTMLLAFAGLAFYGHDRWIAWQGRSCCSEVAAEVVCRSHSSSIVVLTWNASSSCDLMPGSRWVYLCIGNISATQWHPLSVVQIHNRRHVLVKGLGDWSSSLCDIIASGAALSIKTEGPFGRPVCKPDTPSHALLLVAGGVGISPFVDLLSHVPQDATWWHKITVIWAVRRHEYDGLSAVIDLDSFSHVANISVFITSQEVEQAATHTRMNRVITASLDRAELLRLNKNGLYCAIFVSCVVIVAPSWASCKLREKLCDVLDDRVNTLAQYAFALRVAPVLIGVLLAVTSSLVLLLFNKLTWLARDNRVTVDENLNVQFAHGEPLRCRAPQVHFAKPDLHLEMEQEAKSGPVDVQVCGPERMIVSVAQAAKALNMRNYKIKLDVHDSIM